MADQGTSQQATDPQFPPVEQIDEGQEPLYTDTTSDEAPIVSITGKLNAYLVTEVGNDSICLVGTSHVVVPALLMWLRVVSTTTRSVQSSCITFVMPTNPTSVSVTSFIMFPAPADFYRYHRDNPAPHEQRRGESRSHASSCVSILSVVIPS